MDEFFEELSMFASDNPIAEGISIAGDGGSGCGDCSSPSCWLPSCIASGELHGYGFINGSRTGCIGESSSSSRSTSTSRSTPSEGEPRLWLPEGNTGRSASATSMEELGLLEKLRFMQIQKTLTRGSSALGDDVTAHPCSPRAKNVEAPYFRNCVIPNPFSLHETKAVPMDNSNGWMGDRLGFDHPYGATDDPLSNPYHRYKSVDFHFNPNLSLLIPGESTNGFNNAFQYGLPVCNGRSNKLVQPTMGFPNYTEALGFEDSFIMQGKRQQINGWYIGNGHGAKRMGQINNAHTVNFHRFQMSNPTTSLLQRKRTIYNMARDQDGCRFLQKEIEKKNLETIDFYFFSLIDHLVELMQNQFGNYLIQKLIGVIRVEQRMMLILSLVDNPYELIRLSLNTHGTRVVQKLIETLKTKQEIYLVTAALGLGTLKLIKDLNGNHVLQKCVVSLKAADNKFIYDAATNYCAEIATDQHGCCVLQCCITNAPGDYFTKLMLAISTNALLLARDPFGNYVVQHALDHGNRVARTLLLSQATGHFVDLSMHKYSSNVVERFLKVLGVNDRTKVVLELLHKETFEQLVQDPFGNYVIQRALDYTEGFPLYASLMQAIRPLAHKLKNNLYCRRIYSKVVKDEN